MSTTRPYTSSKPAGPIDLWLDSNEGPPWCADSLGSIDPESVRRYPDASRVRSLFARRFGIDEERVLVTPGGDDAIDRFFRAFVRTDDEVLLTDPTFEMVERYARLAGGRLNSVPWREGRFPVAEFIGRIGAQTRAIVVVSPNNPTGLALESGDLARIGEAAPGVPILIDLAYAEFANDDLMDEALAIGSGVIVRTLSKAWGMAGARVGCAIASDQIIRKMQTCGAPYGVSGPSLALAERAMVAGDERSRTYVECVRSERDELRDSLAGFAIDALPSQANFVLARSGRAGWLRDGLAGLGIATRVWTDRKGLDDAIRVTLPGNDDAFEHLRRSIGAVLAPEAILFDLDGVLADVSRSYRRAIIETARTFGVELTPEDIADAKREGDANNDWVLTRTLLSRRGIDASLEDVTERFERIYQGTPDTPGLKASERLLTDPAWLRALSTRLPLAIVTGRPRRDAMEFLEREGIDDCFRTVVTMEDGPAKPDPTVVRVALERLGVTRAWMIGDTVDDVVAARNAGVVPLGVCPPGEDARDALARAGAARVLRELDELGGLLP